MAFARGTVRDMPDCSTCGGHLRRQHRSWLQRLVFRSVDTWPTCLVEVRVLHTTVYTHVVFLFSRYTHCPGCGTGTVHRSAKRDQLDSHSRHPLSWLQRLLGAPRCYCF